MPEAGCVVTPRTPLIYRLVQRLARGLFRLYGGLRVRGREYLPAQGGAVLCPNHLSYLDPPAVGCVLPRHTYFMAKQELFAVPLLGPVIRALYAFPVDRGGADRAAVRRAIAVLEAGNFLTVFPEGGRSPDGALQPANTGPAMFAARAGVPLIPVAVRGTDRVLPRGSVFLHRGCVEIDFGPPIAVPDPAAGKLDKDALRALTEQVMQGIETLQKQQYERAGQVAPPRVKEPPDAQ